MLVRESQIDVVAAEQERCYAERYTAFFRAHLGSHLNDVSNDGLRSRIIEIVRNLRSLRITEPGAYAQIVAIAILVGPEFESDPRIRALLSARGLADGEKVLILRQGFPEQPAEKR
jgi:hypothetical protein